MQSRRAQPAGVIPIHSECVPRISRRVKKPRLMDGEEAYPHDLPVTVAFLAPCGVPVIVAQASLPDRPLGAVTHRNRGVEVVSAISARERPITWA